jgi:hypothetical protein
MRKAFVHGLISSLFAGVLAAASGAAVAKLPALNDEAKAKAAEAAAKTAWAGKVDSYLLCKSQDKVAASYYKTAASTGKPTKPAAAVPPCADPGPFVYTAAAAAAPASAAQAKPVEAAGAHSPAATAASPPSGPKTDAVVNPAKKS